MKENAGNEGFEEWVMCPMSAGANSEEQSIGRFSSILCQVVLRC